MKASPKTTIRLLKWSVLHALWLIFLTFLGLRIPHTTDEEMKLIQWTSGWKRIYLKSDRPPESRFLFVNVAWEKQLVPRTDQDGFVIGNDIITNRGKLAQFISTLNEKPDNYKFLIVDVRYEEKFDVNVEGQLTADQALLAMNDSLLVASLKGAKNYVVSYHADVQGRLKPPVFDVEAGLSNYETTDEGTIVKFSAIQADTARTTPLLIHQAIYHSHYKKGFLFDFMNGRPVLNSFIIDHRILIHPSDFASDTYYSHAHLGEILKMPSPLIHELVKDRIVVLGDFEDRDIHETIYGALPGPIILVNAFLAFENGDNRITAGFVILLLIGYTFISYRCFSQINFLENIIINRLPFPEDVKKILATLADYLILLIILSIVSYFLFNIHVTILLLAIYMQVLEWVIAFFSKKKRIHFNRTSKIELS